MIDLDAQLTAEEHRQGLGVIDGHCTDCNRKASAAYREKKQRECVHRIEEVWTADGQLVATFCRDCGVAAAAL